MSDEKDKAELEIQVLHTRNSELLERIEDLEKDHRKLAKSHRVLLKQLIATSTEIIDLIAEEESK